MTDQTDFVFQKQQLEIDEETICYRSCRNVVYIKNPVHEIQKLSIYAPEAYFEENGRINGYTAQTAPIFFPNTVGGYMPGPQDEPGRDQRKGTANTIFRALQHGYVVVSPGVRGRGLTDENGSFVGYAPAVILDLKAAVRFLRAHAEEIPGDTEKIISNGTSAGGAVSALLGASGNHPDYEAMLEEMGAEKESDQIFAASCYCPITNLDHADMAYEWEFCGLNDYHRMKMIPPKEGEDHPSFLPDDGEMSREQQQMSGELKALFPAYLNSLQLTDEQGAALTLDAEGNGSFKQYVLSYVAASAQGQLDQGEDLTGLNWLVIENGSVKAVDFDAYVQFRTRMKAAPAFDFVTAGTPENELFGTADIQFRVFTEYGKTHTGRNFEVADAQQIRLMNAMNYAGDEQAQTAPHFRIRHGSVDRDTSLAISAMLTVKLRNSGIDADLAYPWGLPHSGDYDLDLLFGWIDQICR